MKCNFDKLVRYLDKKMNLDEQLEILGHLDDCEACFDAMYQISRDRHEGLYQRQVLIPLAS